MDEKPPFKMRTETTMEQFRYSCWKSKEPETIAWIQSFSPQDVFFDVGANIGIYSLYAASLFPEMIIYAFEPMPVNYDALLENKNLNNFQKIICWPYAVGDQEDREVILSIPDYTAGASGAQFAKDECEGAVVNIVTIDHRCEIVGNNGFYMSGMPKPHHVKIDIDGQELMVVRGMQKTLPKIKSILIEVSSKTKQECINLIMPHGFTMDNRFNSMTPHSRERRVAEGIDAENIIFMR